MADNPFLPQNLDAGAAEGNSATAGLDAVMAGARETLLPLVQETLRAVQDRDIPLPQRLELLAQLNVGVIPTLFAEMLAIHPNPDRSVVAARAVTAVEKTAALMIKKREVETNDDLNPHSAKFQTAFGWIIDAFVRSLKDAELNEIQIGGVMAALGEYLTDYEDKLIKRLKGVQGKALAQLENPLVQDFTEKLAARAPKAEIARSAAVQVAVETKRGGKVH